MSGAGDRHLGVVGLGYVGLPLALHFASHGVRVTGLDIDSGKVGHILAGRSYIGHIPAERVAAQVKAGLLDATVDFSRCRELTDILICVPTPLTHNREPDLRYVLGTAEAIAPHLRKGALVVLESTTYPGTTEEELRSVLERGSGMRAGDDFHLAFSPEREDPGNPQSQLAKIPKVVGGLTPACLERAVNLYRIGIEQIVPVSSCRVAEAAKLTENIFRAVNIAMVNELKTVYAAMGIDVWEVIAAARTKPFGFMAFYPGPGLGGHCIPIDPFYLTWKARQYGQHTRFIELAGEINTAMPDYVVRRASEALNDEGKPLRGSRVLILGLAYKPDVDDDRESPSYVLMEKLEKAGARVDYNDPFVPEIRPSREFAHYAGRRSTELSGDYDLLLLATAHSAYRSVDWSRFSAPIVDTRNVVPGGYPKLYKA